MGYDQKIKTTTIIRGTTDSYVKNSCGEYKKKKQEVHVTNGRGGKFIKDNLGKK